MDNIVLVSYLNITETQMEVVFSIKGVRYVYKVESYLADDIIKLAKHAPGKALNMAKRVGELFMKYKI